jgi:drug/metabolite transporter (DMT)-like permease
MPTTTRAAVAAPSTSPRRTAGLAAAGLAVAVVVILAGNWDVQPGENGGTGPALVTAAFCLVVAGILFGIVVPRTRRPGRTALVLGIVAVLSLVVFWSGVTPVIAAAAVAVPADPTTPDRRVAIGRALGVAATVLVVAGSLATSHLL